MMDQAPYYHAVSLELAGDPRKMYRAKQKFGTWKRAYDRLRYRRHRAAPDAGSAWRRLEHGKIALVLFENAAYPPLLREAPGPPGGLYYLGTLPPRDKPVLAVVGTRRATPGGMSTARRFAGATARAGLVIASGLALGIDSAAHEGCLAENGMTVAVLACGLHTIYPRENARLAKKILANGGAIVSEYPPGEPAFPYRFIERNRIVSGLARGTLVIEAPNGSGSLATARFAMEQNRDVYVVPGPIDHANFEGSHALIRQGATLATRPEEILEEYGIKTERTAARAMSGATAQEMQVLTALAAAGTPIDVDKIATVTKLEARIVASTLSFLALRNIVKEEAGGYTIEK